MFRKFRLIFGVYLAAVSSAALAEDIQGLVRIVGNAASSKVVLTPESAFVGPHLCATEQSKRVRLLDGMVVKAAGSWQVPTPTDKCFNVTSFTVLKTPAGNDATVGKFIQSKNTLQLQTEDGRMLTLVEPTAELRKLVGKKIIADARIVGGADLTDKDATFKTIYAAEFP